jgi:radical SAM superfamily enzyme YgiQ (UPF0313 family)
MRVTEPNPTLRGLRVLLINCPLREDAPPNCAPLGPALLAARLQGEGAEVALVDLNAYRIPEVDKPAGRHLTIDEAVGLIRRTANKHGEPHLIGLGGMITTLRWQRALATALRREFPNAMLVSGGGLATEFRDGLFNWMPELDAIVHSEADDVILRVGLDALSMARSLGTSRGHGRAVYAGGRPADLDALPLPAWDLLAADVDGFPALETYINNEIWGLEANNSSATPFKMTRSLNTVSSRGCPFECAFCFRGAQGERNWGVRSARCIAAEAAWLNERYGVDFIGYLDDNFLVSAKRIEEMVVPLGTLCREKGIRWGTHGRLDEAADLRPDGKGGSIGAARRRADAMAEAGCAYIGFGAESASPRVLTSMGKGGFILSNGTERIGGFDIPKTMRVGYSNVVKAGIHGNCTWISGWPNEDLREFQHSVAFIQWQRELIGNDAACNKRFFQASAYPGTEFFKHPKVRARLTEGFGLNFDAAGESICDDALLAYTLELDDADKVLTDLHGQSVYYGEMPLPLFEKVRGLIDEGDLDAVMRL